MYTPNIRRPLIIPVLLFIIPTTGKLVTTDGLLIFKPPLPPLKKNPAHAPANYRPLDRAPPLHPFAYVGFAENVPYFAQLFLKNDIIIFSI